jgi:hypothetical protein
MAAALLSCLAAALPLCGQIHAASQPQSSGVIAFHRPLHLWRGSFSGHPGTTILVGPNGVITIERSPGCVSVTPDRGYVLARFNPRAGRWEAVRDLSVCPRKGLYALVSRKAVPYITSLSVQLARIVGGRTTVCAPAHDRHGHVLSGCQIVSISAPARAHLTFTVRYAGAPKFTQSFVATVDRHGRYHGAFAVTYSPPARQRHGVAVTLTVVVALVDGAYGGTATITFVDLPRTAPTKHSLKHQRLR